MLSDKDNIDYMRPGTLKVHTQKDKWWTGKQIMWGQEWTRLLGLRDADSNPRVNCLEAKSNGVQHISLP